MSDKDDLDNKFLDACGSNWSPTVQEMLDRGHDPETPRSVRGGKTFPPLHGAVLWSAIAVVEILVAALKKKHEKDPEKLITSLADGRVGDRGEFKSTLLMIGKDYEGITEGNRIINEAIAEAIATVPDEIKRKRLSDRYLPPERGGHAASV